MLWYNEDIGDRIGVRYSSRAVEPKGEDAAYGTLFS